MNEYAFLKDKDKELRARKVQNYLIENDINISSVTIAGHSDPSVIYIKTKESWDDGKKQKVNNLISDY